MSGDAAIHVYLNTPNRFTAESYNLIWDILEQEYGVSHENPDEPRVMPAIVKFEGKKGTFKYLFKYFVAMMENFGGDTSIDLNQILIDSLRGRILLTCKKRFPGTEEDRYSRIWEYLLQKYGHELSENKRNNESEESSDSTPNYVPDSCIPTSKLRRDAAEKNKLTRKQIEAIRTISSVLTCDAKRVPGGILYTYSEVYRDFDGITVKEILCEDTHQASGYTPVSVPERKSPRINLDE